MLTSGHGDICFRFKQYVIAMAIASIETPMLEAAVRAGGECLQIRPSQGRPAVRVVNEETGETDRVNPVTSETLMSTMMGVLQGLLIQLEKMTVQAEPAHPRKSHVKANKKF